MSIAEKTAQSINSLATRAGVLDVLVHMTETDQVLESCMREGNLFTMFADGSVLIIAKMAGGGDVDLNVISAFTALEMLEHYYPFDSWLKAKGKGSYQEIRGNILKKKLENS